MEWFRTFDHVKRLARWLIDEHRLTTAIEVYDYFDEPWKWDLEWDEMQAATGSVAPSEYEDLRSVYGV